MIASEIMLPPHAPEIYLDRATLWNAVESCEKHPKAQLAYSFDIAMQNELTLEENMELARKFVQEQFVAKGMIADLAFHSPEKEDGGIPNPHFHVMTTMRPLNPDGTWGQKQRREYLLDEDGNRIRDKNGDYMFNAVHTTDWHEPETLEHWREQWAAAVNTKFEEKGLDVRIDHRSYVRQGLDLIPTVHEGANVRQRISYTEYLLDILLYGEIEEKAALIAAQGKEVLRLEQRISELAAGNAGSGQKDDGHNGTGADTSRNPGNIRGDAERRREEQHPKLPDGVPA